VEFVTTGKTNVRDLASTILKELANVAIRQALAMAIGAPAGTAGGEGTGLFGLIGGLFGGTAAGTAHRGGILGQEEGPAKNVPMHYFMNAPRYHGGGTILGPNEVPIIGKKGEGVFTKEQMRAMGGGGTTVINVDARGATDPRIVEAAARRGAGAGQSGIDSTMRRNPQYRKSVVRSR
jgi:lambda family phage tail tape measure protein